MYIPKTLKSLVYLNLLQPVIILDMKYSTVNNIWRHKKIIYLNLLLKMRYILFNNWWGRYIWDTLCPIHGKEWNNPWWKSSIQIRKS